MTLEEVKKIVRGLMAEKRNLDDEEWEEIEAEMLKIGILNYEKLIDAFEIGIKNGYSVEDQITVTKFFI